MTSISLKVLYDLKERLADCLPMTVVLEAERVALDWAEANGLLADRERIEIDVDRAGKFDRREAILARLEREDRMKEIAAAYWRKKYDEDKIPAGPHDEVEPDGESALSGASVIAPATEGPEGAEGMLPPEDAPVPPVAGGGTPLTDEDEGSKLGLAWTDEEDARAIAMKVDGASNQDIAEAMGRTKDALAYRFSTKLKVRLQAAREAAIAKRAEDAPEAGEPPAIPEDRGSEPVASQAATDRGGDDAKPLGASTVAAPPFDPSRPYWWREIDAHLNSLGYRAPFDPELDLDLVEALTEGSKLAEIAADMGINAARLKERWVAMLNGEKPTIEVQQRLLEVLRHRSTLSRLKAAE